jgi:hypothetical protein
MHSIVPAFMRPVCAFVCERFREISCTWIERERDVEVRAAAAGEDGGGEQQATAQKTT